LSFHGIWAIVYRDFLREKRRGIRFFISMILGPLLFFIAFGWGLGKNVEISGISYPAFILAGLIAMNGMNTAFSIGMTINVERFYWRTFEEFQIAPISIFDIAVGKIITGVIKGVIGSILIYLLGITFGFVLKINILFVVSIVLNCFMFSAMALWIALIVKTHAQQGDFNSFIMNPMAFLSGVFFPIDRFSVVFKYFSMFLPLTHSVSCIRAAAISKPFPYVSLAVVIFYSLCFLILATKSIKDLSL